MIGTANKSASSGGAGKYRNGADGPDIVRVRFRVGDTILGLRYATVALSIMPSVT